jgi:hypothetical protein
LGFGSLRARVRPGGVFHHLARLHVDDMPNGETLSICSMRSMLPIMARYTSTIFPVKKVVNLTAEQAKRIRDYRFAQQIDSENEAIRQLIEAGLGKAPASTPSGGSTPGSTRKPAATAKPAPRAKKPGKSTSAPKAKALPMSKEAQIRALREEGA